MHLCAVKTFVIIYAVLFIIFAHRDTCASVFVVAALKYLFLASKRTLIWPEL